MLKYFSLSILFGLTGLISLAQKLRQGLPFSIRLEQVENDSFPALQSFAFATWQGKWLLIGGRIDGLHRRQPWASFDEEGQNKYVYVVDPASKKVWKYSTEELPVPIAEQFQSTNMEFSQTDNRLILTGGYGYSKTSEGHITFPYLTVIRVDEFINAILTNVNPSDAIVQVKDERMAVTGGRLAKKGNTFLLAGGQRFDGRYNPHGPDHGPGFTQQYTNEIRKFIIDYDNNTPIIKQYSAIYDSLYLHRRDYNLVPQVFKNNELGYTMFSGVFQYKQDLPFTNFVDIAGESYTVNKKFQQKLNNYHSAVLPMYDKSSASMFTVFFGGIAQFYPDGKGKMIYDKDVPFTKTISVIIRNGDKAEEFYLPVKMPGYLGAAAEFIFLPDTKMYKDGIVDINSLQKEEILIGYIVGGINSSDKNIFWDNTGKESITNNKAIKVYIKAAK